MTEEIWYRERIDSCETCPGRIPEHGIPKQAVYGCKHDETIKFRQNRDMGIPENCPMRNLK